MRNNLSKKKVRDIGYLREKDKFILTNNEITKLKKSILAIYKL